MNEDEYNKVALKNILKEVAQKEKINNFEVFSNNIPVQGEGISSEFFTGEVLNKDNGRTIQVAIKKAPLNGFTSNVGNVTIYKTEVYFYITLFPELNKFQLERGVTNIFDNIPKYFASNVDPTNLYVAMENLKTAGYVLFDKTKYIDREHMELIFKTYAKYHALSFTFKEKHANDYELLMDPLSHNRNKKLTDTPALVTLIEKAFLTALKTFDPITESNILERLEKIDVRESLKMVQTYNGDYECLIHGDSWSNNLLFKYKESGELTNVKILDFQRSCSGTPIHDLSYIFYSGAAKDDLDKLDCYLDVYYQTFSEFTKKLGGNPEETYPLGVLKKEWKLYGALGIFLGCQLWIVKLMNQDDIVQVLNQRDIPAAKYWEMWAACMPKVREGAAFQERARNIYLHAIEYGIL